MAIPSDTPARQRREMKRRTHTSTSFAPRRLLLQERAPTAANNTTAPATNSTSSSKATAIPPQPPKSRYYPSDMPPPDTNGSTETVRFDSSSVAITALVILSALFFLGFFSVYARRFFAPDWDNPDPSTSRRRRLARRGRMAVTGPGLAFGHGAPRGLDPDAIKALPLVRYSAPADQKKSQDGKARGAVAASPAAAAAAEDDHRCCAVCLGEFEDGEELRAIPGCGHAFHRECIDAWLSARGSCPLCRSTDLLGGAGKNGAPGSRCEACRLESVVVVPSAEEAAAASVAGQGNGGGGQQRRSEGGNGQLQHQAEAAPSAAAPMASPEARGLGGVGRSRSWLCMSAAAADEKADDEKGPPPAEVAREERPPRRSCS